MRLFLLVAGLVAPPLQQPVSPQATELEVAWSGPTECNDAEAATRTIEEAIRASGSASLRGRLVVSVTQDGPLLHAEVGLPDGSARALRSPSCETLRRAIAQLALVPHETEGPSAAAEPQLANPTPEEPDPVDSAPSKPVQATRGRPPPTRSTSPNVATSSPMNGGDDTPQPVTQSRRTTSLRWSLDTGARVNPSATGFLASDLALRWRSVSIGAGFTHSIQRPYARPGPFTTARSSGVRALVCFEPRWARWTVGACTGPHVQLLHVTGRGPGVRSQAGRSVWPAAHAASFVQLRTRPRLGVRAGLAVDVSVRRPRFHVQLRNGNREEVLRAPAVSAMAFVGISWRVLPWKSQEIEKKRIAVTDGGVGGG